MVKFQLQSTHTNYEYTIRIREPKENKEQQPAYFVLDGSWYYEYIESIVERQSFKSEHTRIDDAWVISIEHGADQGVRRFYDFTPYAEQYIYPERFKSDEEFAHGGAEDFHLFLKNELMPAVESYGVPKETARTLFGHSLAGLYVAYESIMEDSVMDYGLSISPSFWWNEQHFFRIREEATEKRPLFIAVGEEEGFMVADAQSYVDRFGADAFYVAEGENHGSVVPTVMSRAFRHFYRAKK